MVIHTLLSIGCTLLTDACIILLFCTYYKNTKPVRLLIERDYARFAEGTTAYADTNFMRQGGKPEMLLQHGIGLTGNFFFDLMIMIGFSSLLFIIYYLLISHNTVSYLREIHRGIERIKEGDFDTNIRVLREDELSIMAQSVNEMRCTIKELMEKERMTEKTKNDLITNVAHDLRTPLTSIIGYLELLRREQSLPEETQKKYVNIAYDKSKRLQNLVVDLFDYTRYVKDGVNIQTHTLELNRFLEQLVEEFYPGFQDAKLECQVKLVQEDLNVSADGELLARAFGNLISNAMKYGVDGKLIIVETKVVDQWASVAITNFGQIIPKSDQNKIFEKFYRVESSRSVATGGTGLGLAITKNIISMHNGSIRVKSDENGTVFEVRLPMERKEET